MKVAIFANTPAQFHFYKNIGLKLKDHGSEIRLLLRDYGETLKINESVNLTSFVYLKTPSSKLGKILSLPIAIYNAYKNLKHFEPDIIIGSGLYDVYTAKLLGTKSVIFCDSEPIIKTFLYDIQLKTFLPLADSIITPAAFLSDLGDKQIRINSYKELAYLHPNYFTPNDDIFTILGFKKGEPYILLRLNAFDSVHDINVSGFDDEKRLKLVNKLNKYCKIVVSCEGSIKNSFKNCVVDFPKNRIHDVIFYSRLLITDTQTMTTEAAVLGTPAIRCNSFVGSDDMGNFVELEKEYGLIFNYSEPDKSINKAVELIQEQNLRKEWDMKRKRLLKDKIDMTAFMTWFIENYPDSFKIISKNPKYQDKFK